MSKKQFLTVFSAVLATLAVISCNKNTVKFFNFEIEIDESGLGEEIPAPESYLVTFTNTNTGEITEITSTNKKVSVEQLMEGVYDVVATARYSIYNYIGTSKAAVINSETSLTSLKITASKASSLIFKEIFYCCSRTPENTMYMKDNFFEIYNNGTESVYVDGLCIGTTSNYSSSIISFADKNGNMVDTDGNPLEIKSDDYVTFNGIIWQIPGDGKTYLLNPGESCVIASWATDHTVADLNPNSIDLSSAEFETVCDNYVSNGQIDNPESVNMIFRNPLNANVTKQFMPSVLNAGFILVHLDRPVEEYPVVTNAISKTGKYLAVPRADVLDGVNWVKNTTTDPYLPENIDAGKTFVSGTYVNESIVRKVSKTSADGIYTYQDTNNSTNDFESGNKPEIRRNGAKKASWTTSAE